MAAIHPASRPYLLDALRPPPDLARQASFPTQALRLPDPTNPSRASLWLTAFAVGADGGGATKDDLLLLSEIAQAGADAEPYNGFWPHMMAIVQTSIGNRQLARQNWTRAAGANRWHPYPDLWKSALAASLQRSSGRPMGWHAPMVEGKIQAAIRYRLESMSEFYGAGGRGWSAAMRSLQPELGAGGASGVLCATAAPAILLVCVFFLCLCLADAAVDPERMGAGALAWQLSFSVMAGVLAGALGAGMGAWGVFAATAVWLLWLRTARSPLPLWMAPPLAAACALCWGLSGGLAAPIAEVAGVPVWQAAGLSWLGSACAAGVAWVAGGSGLPPSPEAASDVRRQRLIAAAGVCFVAAALVLPVAIALDQPISWQTALISRPN